MHWEQVLTVFAIVATNLGTVLTLYINLDKKLDENRKETHTILEGMRKDSQNFQKAIQEEMKEFHTKLALQDQEFKMRLCSIEEKNRK
jgi:hypothetical protein